MAVNLKLGGLCIDCRTDDLTEGVAFWGGLIGREGHVTEEGKYAEFDDADRPPRVILQAVDHDSRVHLDLVTDDQEGERARLEELGARVVDRVRDWIVMEAPTGHRFCLVPPEGARE